MILKYTAGAGYTHPDNEVRLTILKRQRMSERGYPDRTRHTWVIEGFKKADSQAELTTALNTLVSAYAANGGDLIFYLEDGTTESHHKIASADTISGVRIVGPVEFPEGRGPEYDAVNGRHFRIIAEAEYLSPNAEEISAWQEIVTVEGQGGGEFVILQPITGAPVRQEISESSALRMIQEGRAVGNTTWPTPPDPLSPSHEHKKRRRIAHRGPREEGGTFIDYETLWRYEFETVDSFTSTTPNNAP